MFEHIESYHGDPILSLMEEYQRDTRDEKVNLSIGLYYDQAGKIPYLDAVRQASSRLKAREEQTPLYLPMSGSAIYCRRVQELIFGDDPEWLAHGNMATIQTLGGSGALKVGADFLKRWFPQATVWVSDPTWENHITLFEGAGFHVQKYPYFNALDGQVNIAGMMQFISHLSPGSIVLLHPCCHNPTGADLTMAHWDALIAILKDRKLIPFLDMAYHGLAQGFHDDLYAVHAMAKAGITYLLSTSFSKIFSLYGERVGALSVVCGTAEEAARVLGQLKATVRKNYSSPPIYGASLITEVLGDPQLKAMWLAELEQMRLRMRHMREKLYGSLLAAGAAPSRYQFLLNQQGMFSYTGFSAAQVERLRTEYAVYLIASGRICVAGLNDNNLAKVAQAMLAVEQVHDLHLV